MHRTYKALDIDADKLEFGLQYLREVTAPENWVSVNQAKANKAWKQYSAHIEAVVRPFEYNDDRDAITRRAIMAVLSYDGGGDDYMRLQLAIVSLREILSRPLPQVEPKSHQKRKQRDQFALLLIAAYLYEISTGDTAVMHTRPANFPAFEKLVEQLGHDSGIDTVGIVDYWKRLRRHGKFRGKISD